MFPPTKRAHVRNITYDIYMAASNYMAPAQARRKAALYTSGSLLFMLLTFITAFISCLSSTWAGLALAALFALAAWNIDRQKARFISAYARAHIAKQQATQIAHQHTAQVAKQHPSQAISGAAPGVSQCIKEYL